jgi:hypothetical protein
MPTVPAQGTAEHHGVCPVRQAGGHLTARQHPHARDMNGLTAAMSTERHCNGKKTHIKTKQRDKYALPRQVVIRIFVKCSNISIHVLTLQRPTGFIFIADQPRLLNLNSVNQLIFVMVKCGVLFEVRTGLLNNI